MMDFNEELMKIKTTMLLATVAAAMLTAAGCAAQAVDSGRHEAKWAPLQITKPVAGIFKPCQPQEEINLAGEWQFKPENASWRTIQVPGGGWLKQGFNCEAGI